MTLENPFTNNPFLTRELRQLARRPRALQASLLASLGAMLLVLLLWLAGSTGPAAAWTWLDMSWFRTALLWCLVAAHVFLCFIAASYGGYRIFAAEHLRATLDSILLLPYGPARWLWLKLAFPLLALATAWFTALPIYIMAALGNMFPIQELLYYMHKPLLAGLGALAMALMSSPEYLQRTQQAYAQRANAMGRMDVEVQMWTSMLMAFAYLLAAGLFAGTGLTRVDRPFYNAILPEWGYWAIGAGTFVPAAFLTAMTALISTPRRERLARGARLLAALAIYYSALGYYWTMQATWMQWMLAIGVPLIVAVQQMRQKERREDPYSALELQWVETRLNNPLLVRDMRVYTRFFSIRRYFAWMCLVVLITPLVGAGLVAYWGSRMVWVGLVWGLSQGVMQIMIGMWARPMMLWHKEWTAQTLPQLLLTPMRSDEILLGRMLAVPFYYWVGMAPLTLGALVGMGWLTLQGNPFAVPLTLALSPLGMSFGVWMCCSIRRHNFFSFKVLLGDMVTVLLRLAQTVLLVATLALAVLLGGLHLTPPLAWLTGALLGAANATLAWIWFRWRVRQLDDFRQGDIEVPDNTVMQQQLRQQPAPSPSAG